MGYVKLAAARSSRCLGGLKLATTHALGLAIAIWAAGALPAAAASRSASFTVRVSAVDAGITTIAVGDHFTINLTVDDSTVDTNNATGAGTFPGLLTSFTMTADPGNTGTWTPSGSFDLGAASNFVTNAFGDGFTFQVRGSGFPDGGTGASFFDLDLGFGWPGNLTDSGLGDTFAQQLAPLAFGVPPATLGGGAGIRFETSPGNFLVAQLAQDTAQAIPAAGVVGLALLALALGLFAFLRLR